MFAELHCHTDMGSNTRLTDTTNKVDATIRHAVSMGLRGLAITDHEALCAHIKALNTIKKVKAKQEDLDFTLILGNEIYLCHDTPPIQMDNGKIKYAIESPEFYHFILLAKDKEGHRQLRELSSRAWERAYTYKRIERVPTFYSDLEEIVKPNPGHLIASTACLGGEFDKLILADNVDGSIAFVNWCCSVFGEENFYIELQPGLSADQIKYNTWAVKFCKWYGLPWIITNDVHYLTADKRVLHENFLLSHEEEREVGEFYESTYFKSEEEMIARMRDYLSLEDILSGFENTIKVVDACKNAGDYGLFHSTIIPQRKLPPFEIGDGFVPFYNQCPSLAYCSTSPYEQDRFCLAECERGAREKRIPFTLELAKRIDIELQQVLAISEQLGQRMTSYYNLVQFIVQKAWQVSLVGNGRGSACGFMLCYLMDITQVDSVKWNLPWWRHAHATKIELADIDEDFSPSKRPLIFQMMRDEFGENRCLNIITFKHETSKAAIQTAARGLGIDVKVAREISALVPITRGKVWSIQECLNGNKEEGWAPVPGFADKINSYHPLLLDTVLEIEGLVSGRGVHASGFYIFNSDYVNQNSLMKAPNGTRITCWEMHDSDEAGALKVDLLVTDAVQKIQLCLGLLANDGYIQDQGSLKATYDKYLHPDVLDYETKEMWEMAQQGKIVDLFQFDSAVGSEAIRKSLPYNLKELALANSVMRLMANEDMNPLDHYCALKKDISLWYKEMRDNGLNESEIKVLEKYLLTNYGCSIEQEDMLELVMDPHISDFTMPEANKLKKGVSKKIKELVSSCKELYLKKGKEIHTSSAMLNYVWKYLIQPQLG